MEENQQNPEDMQEKTPEKLLSEMTVILDSMEVPSVVGTAETIAEPEAHTVPLSLSTQQPSAVPSSHPGSPTVKCAGSITSSPASYGMRILSGLPLAFDARRGSMLVPPHTRGGVDYKKPNANSVIRRPGYSKGAAAVNALLGDLAAKKYVLEQNKFFDIIKFHLYSGAGESVIFNGLRRVDGQALALVYRQDGAGVFVMPIDKATENRLLQIRKGSQITITDRKTVIKKARKRPSRRSAVSSDLALRLEMAGISTARAWLTMQLNYDLAQVRQHLQPKVHPLRVVTA